MPKNTFGEYTPEKLEGLAADLQRLVDYFRGAAKALRTRPVQELTIAGETGKVDGVDFLFKFKSFTELALDGRGPKPKDEDDSAKKRSKTAKKKSNSR